VTNSGSSDVSTFSVGAGGTLNPAVCSPSSNCSTGSSSFPEGVAIDPTGRFLYTANNGSSSVSAFSIAAGGALSPVTCDPSTSCSAMGPASGIAADPTGRYVYVAVPGGGAIAPFAIGAGGTLGPIACPGTTCKLPTGARGIAVDPTGRYVYVTDDNTPGSVSVLSIGTGGALTTVSCDRTASCKTGNDPNGVAVDPNGKTVYVANASSATVSAFSIGAGGALIPIACTPSSSCSTGADPSGVAVDPTGRYLFTANRVSNTVSVFAIGSGGALTPIPCNPAANCQTGASPHGIAVDPTGRFLYTSNLTSGSVSAFVIGAGGTLTPIACDPTIACRTGMGPHDFSLAISPDRGPTAAFAATSHTAGTATTFDASASTSPDYSIASYTWNFGDGHTQTTTVPAVQHVYAQPGNYTATLTVTDQANCSVAVIYTGQTASCNGSAKAQATKAIPVVSPIAVLSALSVAPRTSDLSGHRVKGHCVAGRSASHKSCHLKLALKIRYTLSSASSVRFTLTRQTSGRRSGKRCVAQTKHNRRHKRCALTIVVRGALTLMGTAGANTYSFNGKIGGKTLGSGSYTATLTPAGGMPATAKFSISS
jgi:DNA-binding beta-propeller fold protein YncE